MLSGRALWEVWKVLFRGITFGGLESGVPGLPFWRLPESEVSGNSRFGSRPVRTAKPPSRWGYGLGVLEGGFGSPPKPCIWRSGWTQGLGGLRSGLGAGDVMTPTSPETSDLSPDRTADRMLMLVGCMRAYTQPHAPNQHNRIRAAGRHATHVLPARILNPESVACGIGRHARHGSHARTRCFKT